MPRNLLDSPDYELFAHLFSVPSKLRGIEKRLEDFKKAYPAVDIKHEQDSYFKNQPLIKVWIPKIDPVAYLQRLDKAFSNFFGESYSTKIFVSREYKTNPEPIFKGLKPMEIQICLEGYAFTKAFCELMRASRQIHRLMDS